MSTLFEEYTLGTYTLKNRIVMPPMTRSRALDQETANPLMATYYAQRASAGLIVSEGTQISRQGQGYAWTPGLFTTAQVAAWKKITQAVHEAGGLIFAQLWHTGRISHRSFHQGAQPVAPSALQAEGVKVFIDTAATGPTAGVGEMIQHDLPRALTLEEIPNIVADYAHSAQCALDAGFDGVELHAANGYLIDQFINSGSNHRTDAYGGSVHNRLRFLREVTRAVREVVGQARLGVRLAPLTTLQGTTDEAPEATYLQAIRDLEKIGVGYIHIAEADWEDAPLMPISFKEAIRKTYSGTLIYAGKYTKTRAIHALEAGWADLIAFGRPFIANPDLPERLAKDLPLNPPRPEFFFGGGAEGLTDYPKHNEI